MERYTIRDEKGVAMINQIPQIYGTIAAEKFADFEDAAEQNRIIIKILDSEYEERLLNLRKENWKVNKLISECGEIPEHLKDKLFELLGVKQIICYVDILKK